MKAFVGTLAGLAIVANAAASDFSKLAKPEFARAMLISPKRSMEAQCAALARAQVRLGQGMKAADAEAMAAEVAKPLVVEVGDAKMVDELLDGMRFGPREWDDAEVAKYDSEVMDMMASKCAPLFATYRSGGAAAFRASLAAEQGLIPLLPVAECVAVAEAWDKVDEDAAFKDKTLDEMRAFALQGGSDVAQRPKEIEAAKAALAAKRLDRDALAMRGMACFATFAEHIRLVRGEPSN